MPCKRKVSIARGCSLPHNVRLFDKYFFIAGFIERINDEQSAIFFINIKLYFVDESIHFIQ